MKPVFISALITVVASVVFAISAVLTINCSFDNSVAKIYKQVVLEKYTSNKKSKHYHLKIEPWEPYTKTQNVSVSRHFYQQLQAGQLVQVNQKEGLLGIGWYSLSIPDVDRYLIPEK